MKLDAAVIEVNKTDVKRYIKGCVASFRAKSDVEALQASSENVFGVFEY